MRKQPKDPFNGAGDFKPKTPAKAKSAKPKNAPAKQTPKKAQPADTVTTLRTTVLEIRSAAEGALARLHLIDMEAAAEDFEWIVRLADEGLKAR